MWKVRYRRQAIKRMKRLPVRIQEKLDVWVEIATQEGVKGLKTFPGFNDEAVGGEWRGFRSSRLNRQYRVIYSIEKDKLQILVIDVTAHDDKRP